MKNLSYAGLLSLALLAQGCAVQSASDIPPAERQYQTYLESRKPALLRQIGIVEVGHSSAGNIMRSQVALRNRGGSAEQFNYKFRWFDKAGLELDPEGAPWIPVSVLPGDVVRIQGLAPSPAAKSFRVIIDD